MFYKPTLIRQLFHTLQREGSSTSIDKVNISHRWSFEYFLSTLFILDVDLAFVCSSI